MKRSSQKFSLLTDTLMLVTMCDGLFQKRILYRNQRPACQLTEKPPKPQSADANDCNEIHPVELKRQISIFIVTDKGNRSDTIKMIEQTNSENKYRQCD